MGGRARSESDVAVLERATADMSVPVEAGSMVAAVSDRVIDEIYDDLLQLKKQSEFDLVLKMGRAILVGLYRGDPALFAEHGAKDGSLRKLAAKFKANGVEGMSVTWLCRTVQTHLIDVEHGVSARKNLTARHAVAVIGLPADKQAALLSNAEDEGLTTRELESRAGAERKAIRRDTGEKRGRPPDLGFVKTVNHLRKPFIDDVDTAFGDLEELEELDRAKVESLLEVVAAGKQKLAELESILAARLRDIAADRPRRR